MTLPPNAGPDIESLKALDAAIAKARPKFPDLTKSANNPHFKSSYASLETVLDCVVKPLGQNGVSISTSGVLLGESQRFFFCTTITHADGGWRCSYFPVMDPSPQKVGGCETYAQRYNICGLLAITGGADDDGNSASGLGSKPQNGNAPSKPPARSPDMTAW